MKKILVDGYWNGNLGDDLFLKTLCERYPNQDFYIFCSKDKQKFFLNIPNIHFIPYKIPVLLLKFLDKVNNKYNVMLPFSSKYYLYKKAKESNVYIELGGSIFMMPHSGMDSEYIKRKKISNLKKTDYYILGSNFGPYYQYVQLENYKSIFQSTKDVVFRDRASYNLFKDVFNVRYAPDIVFNLKDTNKVKNLEYIVVSVISFKNKMRSLEMEKKYIEYMVSQLERLLQKNKHILLMSFCKSQGDLDVAKEIKKKLLKNNSEYKDKVHLYSYENIDYSLKLIRESEAIIATRYHAMILGWLYQKPMFVVSYSNKINNVILDIFPEQSSIDFYKDNSTIVKFNKIKSENLMEVRKKAALHFKYLDSDYK